MALLLVSIQGHFPAVSALKAAGQTARIVYVFRHLAGLEAETLAA
jgi:hypothetical protein